jgi:pSer/pThr/pTyr-binding forkhead associated (FHA) protein
VEVLVDEENTYHPEVGHPYLAGIDPDVPRVKVLSGTLKEQEFQLTGEEYLIGRDAGLQIVIEEREVSRRHAVILKKAGQYMLCDLDSTNGVYVNNLKLEKSLLKHGDVFQIGSCVFQFFWGQNRPKP